MYKRGLILGIVAGLMAAAAATAEARCGCSAAYVVPSCRAIASSCARSPFRIIRLRAITISSASSSLEPAAPIMSYGRRRSAVRPLTSCGTNERQ